MLELIELYIKMSQNCINSFVEKINNSYICREFNLSKIPQRHKSLGRKVRERQISQTDYNKIISAYLNVFYSEVYYLNRASYFFLGGFIEKKRTTPGVKERGPGKRGQREKCYVEFPISLSWTDLFFLNQKERQIAYIKSKGSGTPTQRIEKQWLQSNNYYDLKSI